MGASHRHQTLEHARACFAGSQLVLPSRGWLTMRALARIPPETADFEILRVYRVELRRLARRAGGSLLNGPANLNMVQHASNRGGFSIEFAIVPLTVHVVAHEPP